MNNDDEIAASKRMHVGRYQEHFFFFFLSQLWLLKRETYKVLLFVQRGQNVLSFGS